MEYTLLIEETPIGEDLRLKGSHNGEKFDYLISSYRSFTSFEELSQKEKLEEINKIQSRIDEVITEIQEKFEK